MVVASTAASIAIAFPQRILHGLGGLWVNCYVFLSLLLLLRLWFSFAFAASEATAARHNRHRDRAHLLTKLGGEILALHRHPGKAHAEAIVDALRVP